MTLYQSNYNKYFQKSKQISVLFLSTLLFFKLFFPNFPKILDNKGKRGYNIRCFTLF